MATPEPTKQVPRLVGDPTSAFRADYNQLADYIRDELQAAVANVAALPATGNFAGRQRWVTSEKTLYVHDGSGWVRSVLGPVGRFKGTITTAKTAPAGAYLGITGGAMFNSIDDPDAGFNAATGLFTVPAGRGGTWLAVAAMKSDGSGAPSAGLQFWRNAAKVMQTENLSTGSFGGGNLVYEIRLSAGDTIGVKAGGAYTTQPDAADNNFVEFIQVQP